MGPPPMGPPGQLGYGYQGSPHLPPRPVAASAPRPQHRRVWIPLACIGLVLVLAAVGGIIALAGRLGADQTFTDADQVVAVHLPRRWADETAWNGGELDGESYVANLELFDDSYGQRFSVWIFPPVTAADLVDAHSANVDDSCSYGTCSDRSESAVTQVDGYPARVSTLTVTDDDGYAESVLVATVNAPRHMVMVEVAGDSTTVGVPDLRELIERLTIDR